MACKKPHNSTKKPARRSPSNKSTTTKTDMRGNPVKVSRKKP